VLSIPQKTKAFQPWVEECNLIPSSWLLVQVVFHKLIVPLISTSPSGLRVNNSNSDLILAFSAPLKIENLVDASPLLELSAQWP
jgi:hypothetical protein